MIEAVMFYALGFLSAGIVALVIGPPIWRRAVRLARRAIERSLPMSPAEIAAEKDQIRAGFAVLTRRLEAKIEQLEAQVAEQLVDINRKREVITHLTAQGSLSADDIVALETRRSELEKLIIERDASLAALTAALAEAETARDGLRTKTEEMAARIETMAADAQTQRMEIIARNTELDNLRDAIAAEKTSTTTIAVQRMSLESAIAELKADLVMERRKVADDAARLREVEAARVAAVASIAERDLEIATFRSELAAARMKVDELSLRLVEAEAAGIGALAIQESKQDLEKRVAELQLRNEALEADLAKARETAREVPSALTEEEGALLRGKLIEFGAAVARLGQQGESPSMVPALPPASPSEDAAPPSPAAVSLAERIRALQQVANSG